MSCERESVESWYQELGKGIYSLPIPGIDDPGRDEFLKALEILRRVLVSMRCYLDDLPF